MRNRRQPRTDFRLRSRASADHLDIDSIGRAQLGIQAANSRRWSEVPIGNVDHAQSIRHLNDQFALHSMSADFMRSEKSAYNTNFTCMFVNVYYMLNLFRLCSFRRTRA